MQNNRQLGTQYEKLAGTYLEEQGYQILCYNYRCPLGEIDIVAKQEEIIVFVEVKYRKTLRRGNPLEAVNIRKQRVISKCANYYMAVHHEYNQSGRFDVIGILGASITHIENAFEYQGSY